MSAATYRLVRADTGAVIAEHVRDASSVRDRALGLMLRRRLPPGHGIWLNPCNGVHTWLMRFPLDVLVLDKDLRVVRVSRNLKPWRLLLPVRGGHSTVELAGGTLDEGLGVGVGLRLESTDERG